MSKKYILYNPASGNGKGEENIAPLRNEYKDAEFIDMTGISYKVFFEGLNETDKIILCGGDGTLYRFVNDTNGIKINNPIYYYPAGTGNDFARDLECEIGKVTTFPINEYLTDLPRVTVNGKTSVFLNNVGFGIDGYCCEVGDQLREKNAKENTDKAINYTGIAIKGLLFHYKPANAIVTVDGKKYSFKKVWIAPTMNGRFYGGGMMATPNQKRIAADRKVSLMVFHGSGRMKTLTIFPSIFKGTHVEHTEQVTVLEGTNISVEFDAPRPLQIDGETVLGVTSYHVEI